MDAFHTLQQAGVTAGPQFNEEMLADDPHVAAREWIRPMTSRDVGSYPHIGYAFQGVPQVWDRGAPVLGEDNDYVFRKVLSSTTRSTSATSTRRSSSTTTSTPT